MGLTLLNWSRIVTKLKTELRSLAIKNTMKQPIFPSPMQESIQRQWWSNPLQHRLQMLQCFVVSSIGISHTSHAKGCVLSSQLGISHKSLLYLYFIFLFYQIFMGWWWHCYYNKTPECHQIEYYIENVVKRLAQNIKNPLHCCFSGGLWGNMRGNIGCRMPT